METAPDSRRAPHNRGWREGPSDAAARGSLEGRRHAHRHVRRRRGPAFHGLGRRLGHDIRRVRPRCGAAVRYRDAHLDRRLTGRLHRRRQHGRVGIRQRRLRRHGKLHLHCTLRRHIHQSGRPERDGRHHGRLPRPAILVHRHRRQRRQVERPVGFQHLPHHGRRQDMGRKLQVLLDGRRLLPHRQADGRERNRLDAGRFHPLVGQRGNRPVQPQARIREFRQRHLPLRQHGRLRGDTCGNVRFHDKLLLFERRGGPGPGMALQRTRHRGDRPLRGGKHSRRPASFRHRRL